MSALGLLSTVMRQACFRLKKLIIIRFASLGGDDKDRLRPGAEEF